MPLAPRATHHFLKGVRLDAGRAAILDFREQMGNSIGVPVIAVIGTNRFLESRCVAVIIFDFLTNSLTDNF